MTDTLIITGFHRSGTSLAAQMLHDAGVPMALDMVGANATNPDGHFEDQVSLEMHDRLLQSAGSNWMYHGECPLEKKAEWQTEIAAYIARRQHDSSVLWGLKDPRLSLFLPQWHQALGGSGHFVIMFRHWALCVQSLLERHSLFLAHYLYRGQNMQDNAIFWQRPQLAARMWLAYNRAILAFAKKHPDNCLLLAQEQLVEGFALIPRINQDFGLNLPVTGKSPVKSGVYNNRVDPDMIGQLPQALLQQLENVQLELCQLANTVPKSVQYQARTLSPSLNKLALQLQKRLAPNIQPPEQPTEPQGLSSIRTLEKPQLLQYLQQLQQQNSLQESRATEAAERLLALCPDDGISHEWQARVCMANADFINAEAALNKSIELQGPAEPPRLKLLLGDVLVAQGKIPAARKCFQELTKHKPPMAAPWLKLALLLKKEKQYPKAIDRLSKAIAINPENRAFHFELADCLHRNGDTDQAVQQVWPIWRDEKNLNIGQNLSFWLMKIDPHAGKNLYRHVFHHHLIQNKPEDWLSELANLAIPGGARKRLAFALIRHWHKILDDDLESWLSGRPVPGLPTPPMPIARQQSASPDELLQQAQRHRQSGDKTATLSCLDKALDIKPDFKPAFVQKMALLEEASDTSALIAHLYDAHHYFPEQLGWRMRYFILRRERGALAYALEGFSTLATEFPQAAGPKMQAGVTARIMGLRPLAKNWFRQAATVSTDDTALIQCVTECLYLGQDAEAKQWIEKIDPDNKNLPWLQVRALAKNEFATAAELYRECLLHAEPGSLPQLIRQGQNNGFFAAIESALQQLDQPLPWTLQFLHIRNLLSLGLRQAAKLKLAECKPDNMTEDEQLEYAELLLTSCLPRAARQQFEQAISTLQQSWDTIPLPQAEKILRHCQHFGDHQSRDAFFARIQARDQSASATLTCAQAWRFAVNGQYDQAEQLLSLAAAENPDLPVTYWQARIAHRQKQYTKSLSLLEGRVQGSTVTLNDATLWLDWLTDSEQNDRGIQECERLLPLYGSPDITLKNANLMRRNLQFEDAIALLQKTHALHPDNNAIALALIGLLLDNNAPDDAQTLLHALQHRTPAGFAWIHQVQLSLAKNNDWSAWKQQRSNLGQQLNLDARLRFQMHCIHSHMHMQQHLIANRLLHKLMDRLPHYPISSLNRAQHILKCANFFSFLGLSRQSQQWLDYLQTQGIAAAIPQTFHRISAACEAFGERRAEVFISHRNRHSNSRHHITLTPFEPAPQNTPPLHTAVLLHLFYPDLWPEICEHLQSLRGTNFQLFVSTTLDRLDTDIVADMKALDPDVQIFTVENRGFDVGAHWQTLEHVDLSAFDVALLLQSKKSNHIKTGHLWRDNLMQALIGSPERWRANLQLLHNSADIGMIGSVFHHNSMDEWFYPEMRSVIRALGMPERFDELKSHYQYVGGTMFLIRASLLREMHEKTRDKLMFEPYEQLSVAKRMDKTLAHAMERAFGLYTCWRGYRIIWRD